MICLYMVYIPNSTAIVSSTVRFESIGSGSSGGGFGSGGAAKAFMLVCITDKYKIMYRLKNLIYWYIL